MMQKTPTTPAETPRIEPEIIPPGGNPHSASRIWVSEGKNRTVHIQVQVARVGPVGMVLLALLIGVIGVAGLIFLLGAAMIGAAAIGALLLGGLVAGLLRRPSRH
jgi:hypothetical protein